MKKCLLCLLFMAVTMLCGCMNWMNGNYVNVKPHVAETTETENAFAAISDYNALRNAVERVVERGEENTILYLTAAYAQDYVQRDLHYVTDFILNRMPVGAYAVSDIEYNIGTMGGMDAVAVSIEYRHNRSEIQAITKVSSMDGVRDAMIASLDKCEAGAVVMVSDYQELDYSQIIEDYAMENPQIVMEVPTVSATTYPNEGQTRIIELSYYYQTSREVLRSMRTTVDPVFASAALYISADAEDNEKFNQLYSFLTQRYEYRFETSITPSYSLLRHGVGDSRSFATVYAAMCRRAGLTCFVVSGTRQGESHFWNIICDNGAYYHLDLLRCIQEDAFIERIDEEMTDYVWNYTAYPVCSGIVPAPEGISG